MRALLASLLLAAAPGMAHHSFAAEFDSSKPVTLHGTITRVDWMNPHVYVWIDAADASGKVVNWMIESAAPNYLQGLGWSKGSVKPGDTMIIQGYISKDQPHAAKMDVVILPGGRRMYVGHPDDHPGK